MPLLDALSLPNKQDSPSLRGRLLRRPGDVTLDLVSELLHCY